MSSTKDAIFTPAVFVSLAGVAVAAIGLYFTLRNYREASLRRGEVVIWATEAITVLEGLVLACILLPMPAFAEEARTRLAKIAFDSAILVERGRIFFKNKRHGDFGADKKPAYRGLRPKVLDSLIAAHQISVRVPDSQGEALVRLQCLAEDHLKNFVSLMQSEIGRQRTAAAVTAEGGSHFNLDSAITSIAPARVALIMRLAANSPVQYRSGAPGDGRAAATSIGEPARE